jgi:AcrR family transcriptional regulator
MPATAEPHSSPLVTRKRAATREKLLTAAAEVFAERGFGRATVEDVCDRAGFSRGAFYSNFDSLDLLFFALYSQRGADLVAAVAKVVDETSPGISPAEVVDRVATALPVSRESHLLNLEFAAHALRHEDVAVALADHRQALREALLPILQTALHHDATAGRLGDIARAVMAVQDGMFLQELLEPGNSALPALRRRILTHVTDDHY